MLFGVISPKIRTVTVITAVATVAPISPSIFTNSTVAIAEPAIFTMLLPTKIVEIS